VDGFSKVYLINNESFPCSSIATLEASAAPPSDVMSALSSISFRSIESRLVSFDFAWLLYSTRLI